MMRIAYHLESIHHMTSHTGQFYVTNTYMAVYVERSLYVLERHITGGIWQLSESELCRVSVALTGNRVA